LLAIDVIVPGSRPRTWQRVLVERLTDAGYDVAVHLQVDALPWPWLMAETLALERHVLRRDPRALAAIIDKIPAVARQRPTELVVDLTGRAQHAPTPTIRLAFDKSYADAAAVIALANGRLPNIEAVLDGQVVGFAAPMVDTRASVAMAVEDVLARAITLALAVAAKFEDGLLAGGRPAPEPSLLPASGLRFAASYAVSALPRLAREVLRRARFRQAHWRVGYRFIDGPGVAETGEVGTGWFVLPDTGERFYADPFPFNWQGQHFIFVEDYSHATQKARLSVVAFDVDGNPGEHYPVIEEDWHLSYPQVFERDGTIWMLPEASNSGKLTLYRATAFPNDWVAEAVLIENCELSDATLLDHGGRLWLFGTDRDGHGSTSDTLVVFHAPHLTGPWTPHRANPILIDRRMARPGGAIVCLGERIVLPMQDGTLGYGGDLGLVEIQTLNEDTVQLLPPRPVSPGRNWPYPRVHTLNRAGRLEVIDGIAAVRQRSRGK
jgi:hypothetical protein